MKKFLYFIFICSLCVGFAACGGDDDNPENFVWGGDWNDPNDSHYEKYQGKYNPIEGDWKNIDDASDILRFSSDRMMYSLTLKPNGNYETAMHLGKYEINNKAFRYGPEGFMTQLYKIENNVLSIKLVFKEGDEQKWRGYTRFNK
ncbi:hypothetical protein [uncultured Dysgonomonas sp.]|uniref:Lipocalin-like domain-containing protein n=1 Tax=uncultured Dysgonomonas sp. TaxID=206096 RepID=A0A212K331_9BACT|nr:hypothetical protein [uncultured Dysgonomonas sp.]SBW06066.1 conserved exported hypothetical protein [uncultured Dysgonomonas sp.]